MNLNPQWPPSHSIEDLESDVILVDSSEDEDHTPTPAPSPPVSHSQQTKPDAQRDPVASHIASTVVSTAGGSVLSAGGANLPDKELIELLAKTLKANCRTRLIPPYSPQKMPLRLLRLRQIPRLVRRPPFFQVDQR
ncbi:hypothetical protein M427DRAFT_211863 [Gonapodya prolifera JEL478]|uniref:Uncharacterized protein n=1 Tax=Gonapodya prolifera (strain JEL478) TaxID=1344416 RepID=A0A139AP47_GONPJ|nr:hypothetical protein M427DRAFT_211863 [Gonapodya prolifera JEL478]|eukprot:KXS18502.1 hypothetical protein M427DRAFT_211863 [Gonapodya prolifera JEL478]